MVRGRGHQPRRAPARPGRVVGTASPPATLALTPDDAADVPIDLSGLDEIPWADLEHAHGPADDVPDLIRALTDPYGDWDETLDELFGDNLLHQGTCYPATAPALPFLTRMIVSGALPAAQRLDLYGWLLTAAGRQADDLLTDADRAAVAHRSPAADDDARGSTASSVRRCPCCWSAGTGNHPRSGTCSSVSRRSIPLWRAGPARTRPPCSRTSTVRDPGRT
ncbi:hypothetical protein [Asanoa siamensis]|uniref:Uncharacterized protein n=1 Tax=Asanoa siamensis TaxID=926357 RepID=A0ABQ4CJU1_9ACTN|nr:hypothetical protein [Asanoa siamensis]GIF71554.1 hypothetical protein Asi02nite_10720 [Asanoa siamensis]